MTKSWLPLPDGDGTVPMETPPSVETHEEYVERLLGSIRAGVWVLASLAIAGVIWGIIDATIIAVNISQSQF